MHYLPPNHMNETNKSFDIKNIIILAIVSCVALCTLFVGYYFLVVVPNEAAKKLEFEKQKWQQEQDEKASKEKEKKDKEQREIMLKNAEKDNLQRCLDDALLQYSYDWDRACAMWKIKVKDTYEDCKTRLTNIGYTLAEAKSDCWTNTPDYTENPEKTSCYLPKTYSEDVDASLKESKEECYKKHPIK